MLVAVLTVTKWAVSIHHKVADRKGTKQTSGIVSVPFCSKWYVNDVRYHVSDRALVRDRKTRPLEYNVVFEQNFCANSPGKYADHSIMALTYLRDTCTGEEVYADYGESWSFPT